MPRSQSPPSFDVADAVADLQQVPKRHKSTRVAELAALGASSAVVETPLTQRPRGTPDSAAVVSKPKGKGGRPAVPEHLKAKRVPALSTAKADELRDKVVALDLKVLSTKMKCDAEVSNLKLALKAAEGREQKAIASRVAAEAALVSAGLVKDAAVNELLAKHAADLQAAFEKGADFAQKLMSR